MDMDTNQLNKKPKEAYATFCRPINELAVQAIFIAFNTSIQQGIEHIHMLFQSTGGTVGDSVCLYNYFKTLPIDLTIYNAGSIQSGGVISYLGAKRRVCSPYSTFMLHRAAGGGSLLTSDKLQVIADSLIMDDAHLTDIVRESSKLPEGVWDKLKGYDIFFNADNAVEWEVAHEIGSFAPVPGLPIFNI